MENNELRVPGLEKALEKTKENDELIRPIVDEIVNSLVDKIDNGEHFLDTQLALSVLAKSITYISQMYCNSEQHFKEELQEANNLVTNNIMAALGAFKGNDQSNNEVVYNKETVDYENFSVRRLAMLSASIIEYTLWRLTLNTNIEQELELEKENENNIELEEEKNLQENGTIQEATE